LEVFYVNPTHQVVTEYEEFTGRTAATETVELRARVSGYLKKVYFDDGADVGKDELLFRLDDLPFIAEKERTAAAILQYEARAKRLQNQERRSRSLFDKQALSQDEYEAIKFDRDEAVASLAAAQASHELAKLNVEYAKIAAPSKGRIGRRLVDEGNLVIADQTLLATIVQLDRIYIYFDMDERTVLRLRRLENSGAIASAMKEDVFVDVALADSPKFLLRAKVDFLDNQVDPATGTLRVRASLDNPDGLLSPGLFVRLKYPIGKAEQSLVIPEESLASDQGSPFVFVINEKDTTEARKVELGPKVGPNRVVRSGLTTSDRVSVTGLQRLRRNMTVAPKDRSPKKEEPTDGLASEEKALDRAPDKIGDVETPSVKPGAG
jgi:RND family efflux transporter MFP subunit